MILCLVSAVLSKMIIRTNEAKHNLWPNLIWSPYNNTLERIHVKAAKKLFIAWIGVHGQLKKF